MTRYRLSKPDHTEPPNFPTIAAKASKTTLPISFCCAFLDFRIIGPRTYHGYNLTRKSTTSQLNWFAFHATGFNPRTIQPDQFHCSILQNIQSLPRRQYITLKPSCSNFQVFIRQNSGAHKPDSCGWHKLRIACTIGVRISQLWVDGVNMDGNNFAIVKWSRQQVFRRKTGTGTCSKRL